MAAAPVVLLDAGANSFAQKSRTVDDELLLVGAQRQVKHFSTEGYYFLGVTLGVGEGDTFGVGDELGDGRGFRSFGPTWPMSGRCWPKLRMKGTVREECSCGCRKPV